MLQIRWLSKSFQIIEKPVSSKLYIYLFLINMVSNLVSTKLNHDILSVVAIVSLSAFIAYCETALFLILRNKWLRRAYAGVVIAIQNILVIVEYFILINFQRYIDQNIIDILGDTNPVESSNFVETYLKPQTIFLYLAACALLNVILVIIVIYIAKVRYRKLMLIISLFGFLTAGYCVFNYAKYRNGRNIPQLTTLTRLGYSLYCAHNRVIETNAIRRVCEKLTVRQNIDKKPTIIVIIGESFSVYHSSLYGYKKNTNPLLGKREKDGSLFLFDNAVTLQPATTASMCADFSLDSLGVGYTTMPMFPACFRKAGYFTAMYDNQYFVGHGISFLTDAKLSKVLFNYRNSQRYTYDEDMIKTVQVKEVPSLYVIHLWGQHYTYKDRFPNSFNKFIANEYKSQYGVGKQQIMANYDNATLYNDYVVNSILNKFTDDYCIVFYFSDHGEEVYELRNFMGHGSAMDSPNANYQLRVPLMVWMSPSYKQANPQMCEKLNRAKHYPICMDDIGHTLLNVAGITCKGFAPTRSFINDNFNKDRDRIVMNSIDYDKTLLNKR